MNVTVCRSVPVSANVTVEKLGRYLVRAGWSVERLGEWSDLGVRFAVWFRDDERVVLRADMDERKIVDRIADIARAEGRVVSDVLLDIAGTPPTPDRTFLAAQTELSQLRRLAGYADSDLVRLALSAWAALADEHPDLARTLEDLPNVVSNWPRRILRSMARANLESARGSAGLADHWATRGTEAWATIDPDRVKRLRREAMVRRFKAFVLLAAAKETGR